jgi:O-antigen/teichoic acid export membrane protein
MAQMKYQTALWSDFIFYCGFAFCVVVLKTLHTITVEYALLCLAGMASISVVLCMWQDQTTIAGFGSGWGLLCTFWPQGRWIAIANACAALTSQGLAWVLAVSSGPSAVAAFQATLNLANAGNPIILGIGNLLVPAASLAGTQSGPRAATRTALQLAARGGVLVGAYFLLVLFLPSTFLSLAYGHQSSYVGLITPLRLFAIAQLIQYPAQMTTALLNSMGENRGAFIAQVAATLATFAVGLPLILLKGVNGAGVGLICSNGARCLTALRVVRDKTVQPCPELAGDSTW